jgi:hypothetical protein
MSTRTSLPVRRILHLLGASTSFVAVTACCCPRAPAPAAPVSTESHGRLAELSTPAAVLEAAADTVTQAEFRNVDFQIAPGVVLGIRHLRGEFVSKDAGAPVIFDDKRSFVIRLASAEVVLDTASLAHLMNEHVFGYRGAPLRNLSFRTRGNQLIQRGVLRKVVDIPFEIRASVSLTPEGHIRVHPTEMKICSVNGEGLMRALGIELADLLDLRKAKGVRVEKNDLILDAEQLLPPPAIQGRLTSVRVEPGRLVQMFGDDSAAARLPALPPADDTANYMYFRGGTLRFGKLFMVRADMRILDADPSDPFYFSIDRYNDQLVAGYSKNRPDLGLEVFMPDLDAVGGKTATAARR